MKKESKGGGAGLSEGLSSHQKIGNKDTTAKPTSTGRASKRPTQSVGRGLKMKGRM